MIRSLIDAFSFLTILPALRGQISEKSFSKAPIWFPLVGYFIGFLCYGIAQILSERIAPRVIAFLILLFLVIITAALHLDGLADWADSFAGRNPEQRLKIMKDAHHGTFGIIALALVLLGKFLAISILIKQKNLLMLALAPGISRLSLTLIMGAVPYARPEGGTAEVFARGKKKWHLLVAFLLALAPVALVQSISGLAGLGIVLVLSLLFAWDGKRRLGGFTGDLLGACVETSEFIILFSGILLFRV